MRGSLDLNKGPELTKSGASIHVLLLTGARTFGQLGRPIGADEMILIDIEQFSD